jgi:homoserine dehydrogenase
LKLDTLLVGFGNIGQNLASVLLRDADYLRKNFDLEIQVVGAVETDPKGEFHSVCSENGVDLKTLLEIKRRTKTISSYPVAGGHRTSQDLIRNSGAQLMLESTPTNLQDGQPGLSHIKSALEGGMSVVTSNKGP